MKRLSTFCGAVLLAAALTRLAQAQTVIPRQWLDNHFAQLDKSQVPTGFLAEYGLPLATTVSCSWTTKTARMIFCVTAFYLRRYWIG